MSVVRTFPRSVWRPRVPGAAIWAAVAARMAARQEMHQRGLSGIRLSPSSEPWTAGNVRAEAAHAAPEGDLAGVIDAVIPLALPSACGRAVPHPASGATPNDSRGRRERHAPLAGASTEGACVALWPKDAAGREAGGRVFMPAHSVRGLPGRAPSVESSISSTSPASGHEGVWPTPFRPTKRGAAPRREPLSRLAVGLVVGMVVFLAAAAGALYVASTAVSDARFAVLAGLLCVSGAGLFVGVLRAADSMADEPRPRTVDRWGRER